MFEVNDEGGSSTRCCGGTFIKSTEALCAIKTMMLIKAKSHYTLADSELVRSWFEPDSVMEFGFEPASNQLRTS